jgi:hypothetical protein
MALPAAISPLDVSCRTVAPDDVIDWHAHSHDELCLVLDGTPTIGHAGSKLIPQDDTLFLFRETTEAPRLACGCSSFASTPMSGPTSANSSIEHPKGGFSNFRRVSGTDFVASAKN